MPSPATPSSPPANPPAPGRHRRITHGPQDIKGLTNQTGFVTGNGNGAINFGTLDLTDNNMPSQPESAPTPTTPPENITHGRDYQRVSLGDQNIKGLSYQTGFVTRRGKGAINFSSLDLTGRNRVRNYGSTGTRIN
ncbi:hypothetical protein O6P43_021848 [Quillaja saponaria]|uniref:Uncharacterized protein n=1 Tax=Quillaja saponaria TaxID=32244 RepID=A0AAD7LBU6_QUISA|nr:hypothetical protein O6P43_021848 [Quillaja saponaria]